MNLEQALNDYLRIRRSLGFRLQQQGNALRNFVAFFRAQGASYITTELASTSVGYPTCQGRPCSMGLAFGQSPTLCHLVQRHRTSH
jgi:hypothetical protein